uniref:Uncharacterized protein n=1 Tax=Knipowitschia caucasica TaxID=637954 RepID=A0AAV2MTL3_KNICA
MTKGGRCQNRPKTFERTLDPTHPTPDLTTLTLQTPDPYRTHDVTPQTLIPQTPVPTTLIPQVPDPNDPDPTDPDPRTLILQTLTPPDPDPYQTLTPDP